MFLNDGYSASTYAVGLSPNVVRLCRSLDCWFYKVLEGSKLMKESEFIGGGRSNIRPIDGDIDGHPGFIKPNGGDITSDGRGI